MGSGGIKNIESPFANLPRLTPRRVQNTAPVFVDISTTPVNTIRKKTMALTFKKRKFTEYLILDKMTQTAAAEKAGYSANSARKQGSRLATDPDVLRYAATLEGRTAAAKHQTIKRATEPSSNAKQTNTETSTAPTIITPEKAQRPTDPKEVLIELMNDVDVKIALEAAKILLPYFHAKIETTGKRQQVKDTAKDLATTGRFATLKNQKLH